MTISLSSLQSSNRPQSKDEYFVTVFESNTFVEGNNADAVGCFCHIAEAHGADSEFAGAAKRSAANHGRSSPRWDTQLSAQSFPSKAVSSLGERRQPLC
jgi:hypothetical protein